MLGYIATLRVHNFQVLADLLVVVECFVSEMTKRKKDQDDITIDQMQTFDGENS